MLANRFFDVRVNCFTVELRFDASEKFALLFRNSESLERAFDILRHVLPVPFRRRALREIVADIIKDDGIEVFAGPMRRHRLAQKSLERVQPKLADPIRILFDIGNVIHHPIAQADAGVVAVLNVVMKVANTSVDIDR